MEEFVFGDLEFITTNDLPDSAAIFAELTNNPTGELSTEEHEYWDTVQAITSYLQDSWQNWSMAEANLMTHLSFACSCAIHNQQKSHSTLSLIPNYNMNMISRFDSHTFANSSSLVYSSESHEGHQCSHCGGEVGVDGKCKSCNQTHTH